MIWPRRISKWHFRGRDPVVRAVVEGLPLQLPHDRLAGADDLLLVLERSCGVFLAEEVEVSLPDHLLLGTVRNDPGEEACANQDEPALEVLEVQALFCGGQEVAHAGELELPQQLALLRPALTRPSLDHRGSCSGRCYYLPTH